MADLTLDIVRWLATDARSLRDPERLMDALCTQFVLAGVPLTRSTWAIQMGVGSDFGMGMTWRAEKPILSAQFDIGELIADRFQQSPFRHLFFGGDPIRRRLLDPDAPLDFPILEDLQKKGVTDYIALPLPYLDGRINATTWATTADFGFEMDHVRSIDAVNDVLPLVLELWELKSR